MNNNKSCSAFLQKEGGVLVLSYYSKDECRTIRYTPSSIAKAKALANRIGVNLVIDRYGGLVE